MKEYVPYDITDRAKTTAAEFPPFTASVRPFSVPAFHRCPQPGKGLTGSDRTKVKVMGRESILINKSLTDLRAVEQLTDSEQLNGLAALLLEAAGHKMDSKKTLVQVVDLLEKQMDEKRPCFSSRSWKTQRPGTAETAGNLCMPEPVQGTAVLRKICNNSEP